MATNIGAPRSYVRILAELEDFLVETLSNKEVKKKMSASNSKALNTMRQRLKKHNAGFAEQIAAWRENPVDDDEEEEEQEPESSSSEDTDKEVDSDEKLSKRPGEQDWWLVSSAQAVSVQ